MFTQYYATKEEAIEQGIVAVLGEEAANYDIDAIADTLFAYEFGNGYVSMAETDEEFWDLVQVYAN